MKRFSLVPGFLTLSVAVLLLAACAGDDAPAATPTATTAQATALPASATAEPGVASGPVVEGKALRSADGGLEVRSASTLGGTSALLAFVAVDDLVMCRDALYGVGNTRSLIGRALAGELVK